MGELMVLTPVATAESKAASGKRVVVIMPAYNASRTLKACCEALPKEFIDRVILTDDASRDDTVELARGLGLDVIVHPQNRGYGGNQKTCYRAALDAGADVVVMIHPDHQYDPRMIPALIGPLLVDRSDAVFGSRMLGGRPLEGGMPKWKYVANVFLTAIANVVFYMFLTEYHSGMRAYTRKFLTTVRFEECSDAFVFDTEIIAQGVTCGMRFAEIPIQTRYFPEASQIGFWSSVRYGFAVLSTLAQFKAHVAGLWRARWLEPRV